MSVGVGELVSDEPLVLTQDFLPAGAVEVDLVDRSYLRYEPPAYDPVYWAEATIGFRRRAGGNERTCVDFRRDMRHVFDNPITRNDARFTALGYDGSQLPTSRLVEIFGHVGWDIGFRGVVELPCVASRVEVLIVHSSTRPTVIAIDEAGGVVDQVEMSGTGPQTILINGVGIVALHIDAPQNETAVLRVCWTCGDVDRPRSAEPATVTIDGFFGGAIVASESVSGEAGAVRQVVLRADAIDRIDVGPGDAALIDLCVATVRTGARGGWEDLDGFPYPLCLPVAHGDYPCPGAPANQNESEDRALDRITYGPAAPWGGQPFVDLHDRLERLVVGGPPPAGEAMHVRTESVVGAPSPPPGMGGPLVQQDQRSLELVLLGSLHPAVAQMVGLYWYDRTAVRGDRYDYLLVADHTGALGGSARSGRNWVETVWDYTVNDGFVAFDVTVDPATPLSAPNELRSCALPGATIVPDGAGAMIDGANNAGLTWDRRLLGDVLEADAPVLYHVWRADLGDVQDAIDPADGDFRLLTEDSPVPIGRSITTPPQIASQPSEWPPFPLHFIDRALQDGWYAYRVSGIDLFGRHTLPSALAEWRQWAPSPKPKPWYYVGPDSDAVLHPSRIRLLDKLPPPPPASVEALALDPIDPTILRDAAFNTWWGSLSAAEQQNVVGLRLRWRWDPEQAQQAPDTREFRIYYHPAPLNTLRGRVTSIASAGQSETDVVTDINMVRPVNSFVGLSIRIGAASFKIVNSHAGAPLRLRVKNIGPAGTDRPTARTRCALTLQPGHPDFVDFGSQEYWHNRLLTVDFAEHVDASGGSRQYEVFLPVAGSADRAGLPLTATLAEPMSAGVIGVTAVDSQQHTLDQRGDAARFGNESRIGGSATVFRVRRQPPPAPQSVADTDKLWASPADYHHHSYFTYRWTPSANLKMLVYRALDDAVFGADLAVRPRPALQATDLALFPSEVDEPGWNAVLRQQAATALNALNALDPTDKVAVRAAYGGLSTDALRVLAGLPGVERVFVQLHPIALDPDEPDADAPDGLRWRRVGPDAAGIALAAGERAFVDKLDGKATNRYFYRSAQIDEVQNVGPMSLATPPVWLLDVVPPREPVLLKALGSDRQVIISWASNREPDLAEYRIYRAAAASDARDIRLMSLVHTEMVVDPPESRPGEIRWIDAGLVGGERFSYRIVAVDTANNVSRPSPPLMAQAMRLSQPMPPDWVRAEWRVDGSAVELEWQLPEPGMRTLVQRQLAGSLRWRAVSDWLPVDTVVFVDANADPVTDTQYRLVVRDVARKINATFVGRHVPPHGN